MAKDGSTRYDWEALKQEYVTTNISIRQISDKYGIRQRTIADRSSKDGWVEARQEYRTKVASKVASKVSSQQADDVASLLRKATKVSSLLLDRCLDALERGVGMSGATIEHMANAAKTAESLARMSTGTLTRAESERLALDRERLEMDKTKQEYKKPDNTITIKIEGYEEEWSE